MTYPAHYLEGWRLYQTGRYWESHEAWEDLWRLSAGAERHLLQALIQLDAVLLHAARDHWDGVANLLRRSLQHLEDCPDRLLGLDVRGLEQQLAALADEVAQLQRGRKADFDWNLKPPLPLDL